MQKKSSNHTKILNPCRRYLSKIPFTCRSQKKMKPISIILKYLAKEIDLDQNQIILIIDGQISDFRIYAPLQSLDKEQVSTDEASIKINKEQEVVDVQI